MSVFSIGEFFPSLLSGSEARDGIRIILAVVTFPSGWLGVVLWDTFAALLGVRGAPYEVMGAFIISLFGGIQWIFILPHILNKFIRFWTSNARI